LCLQRNWINRLHHGNYTSVAKLGLSIPLALISTPAYNPTKFPPISKAASHLLLTQLDAVQCSGKLLQACCVSSAPVTCNSLPDFTNLIRDWVPRVDNEFCTSYYKLIFAEDIHMCYQTKRKQSSLLCQ
jgi:hypothetical protein